jgi:NAD(P)-dependent dehydrogenase (short-subunit alcohol dehydrogenase family)
VDLQLDGTVTLVTGGTDGLGAALAERLVEEGGRVAVCGRDPRRLEATGQRLARLDQAGGDVLAVRADVTDAQDAEAFVTAAFNRWGRVDALVNNAGRSAAGRLPEVGDEGWASDLDLKVVAAARLTRLVVPHLVRAGGGAVLNVLAIAAKAPAAGTLPTAASRAAGLAMTKALSNELGPSGIRVNAILIGLIRSGQWRRRAEDQGRPLEDFYVDLAEGIPLGRVGREAEFADLGAFLLSSRASYVTGAAVNLDGGLSPVA